MKPKRYWLNKEALTFIILTVLAFAVMVNTVDLEPHVDEAFFFSSDDPQFQSERKISKLFARKDAQILISAGGDINNPQYYDEIRTLSDELSRIEAVAGIRSISHGPKSLRSAMESPLWRRALIGEDGQSTNMILILKESATREIIPEIEQVVAEANSDTLRLSISGVPYITTLIQRRLADDIQVFTKLALIIFSVVIIIIFRSPRILIGTYTASLNACTLTLLGGSIFGVRIGTLTANLITIVFVLTLSHIVFITFNWKRFSRHDPGAGCLGRALRFTFVPSFWSMATTFLGFVSLLWVPAKPLHELGIAGSIGTMCALVAAYTIYPSFLRTFTCKRTPESAIEKSGHIMYAGIKKRRIFIYTGMAILCVTGSFGLEKLETDPSLFAYFKTNSEIAKGLTDVDLSGGSSPLVAVVQAPEDRKLNTTWAYHKLWDLQKSLEGHPSVGTVVSLPLLMAEAKRSPFAFFYSWKKLLNVLDRPSHGQIAKSFITKDRKHGFFLMRMRESTRRKPRLEVIAELQQIVLGSGFEPAIFGGVYALQGHLSQLVEKSLIAGLARLIIFFCFVGLIVSCSFCISVAMTISIAFVPIIVLGAIGHLGIPLDIISAPATNVAIAMGIDSMIHMVRLRRELRTTSDSSAKVWDEVIKQIWPPVMTTMLIIALGFSIFGFSHFPPTQRFGFAIVVGAVVAALSSLFLMPFFARTGSSILQKLAQKQWFYTGR
ncbi:MAG: MMPL family transporter [Candidatus Omnitrophota bacterium]|nr:MAG: MMPL family transporter [Candidatus Omnitrophota bacterium]